VNPIEEALEEIESDYDVYIDFHIKEKKFIIFAENGFSKKEKFK